MRDEIFRKGTTIVHMFRRLSIFCLSVEVAGSEWHEHERGWVQRLKSDVRNVGQKNARPSDIR